MAGYGFGIGGLACYFGEMVKTEVTDTKFLMNVSHFKPNVNFLFFMIENFVILLIQVNCSLLWELLSYILRNLENYSSKQNTLTVNKDKN